MARRKKKKSQTINMETVNEMSLSSSVEKIDDNDSTNQHNDEEMDTKNATVDGGTNTNSNTDIKVGEEDQVGSSRPISFKHRLLNGGDSDGNEKMSSSSSSLSSSNHSLSSSSSVDSGKDDLKDDEEFEMDSDDGSQDSSSVSGKSASDSSLSVSRKRRSGRIRNNKIRRKNKNEDDHDTKSKRQGGGAKGTDVRTRRSRRNLSRGIDRPNYNDSSSDHEDEENEFKDDENDDNNIQQNAKPKRIPKATTRRKSSRLQKLYSSQNSDEDDFGEDSHNDENENSEGLRDSDESESKQNKKGRVVNRRSTRIKNQNTDIQSTKASTRPSTRSANKPSIRIETKKPPVRTRRKTVADKDNADTDKDDVNEDGESEENEEENDNEITIYRGSKKNKKADDDSFHLSTDANDDSDDIPSDTNEFEADIIDRGFSTSGSFDDDVSFEDEVNDESDESSSASRRRRKRRKYQVTPLKVRRSSRRRVASSYEEEESGSDADENSDEFPQVKRPQRIIQSKPQRYCLRCSSTEDAITNEPLPKMHVCYICPDGHTRYCFKLETLYKASLMSGIQRQKSDGSGIAFLQPPHFRSLMDDELIDQIASRFGRKALIIEESDVYKAEKGYNSLQQQYQIFNDNNENNESGDEHEDSFSQRFNRYLNKVMGHGDLYCCCICYAEAHRRFRGASRGDDDSATEAENDNSSNDYCLEALTSSRIDPMTILGGLDDDEFEIASTFSFQKLALLKAHIRSVHGEDTSTVRGNDLYQRFMIRAQDGLLQNHLRAFWKNKLFSGAMKSYWFEGHNQSFILLRMLVERRQAMIVRGEEVRDEDFSHSFKNRSKKIWGTLMAPFAHDDEGAADFIADENDDEDVVEVVRPTFEKPESDIEDQFVEQLRSKRRAKHGYSSSSNSSDYDDEEEDVNCKESDEPSEYEEEEEEESSQDEWVAKKLASRPSRISPKRSNRLSRAKEKSNAVDSSDEDIFSNEEALTPSNLAKGPEMNNSEGSDEDDQIISTQASNGRKQIFSSDEDSLI